MLISIHKGNAAQILDWINNREGVAVWKSINLSDLGREILTPVKDPHGNDTKKPHWSMGNTPEIITSIEDITVKTVKEVKRFHVAVRTGSQGMSIKVTDGGSRRIESAVAKAGEGAYYEFDYDDYNNAVIMAPVSEIPMTELITDKGILTLERKSED